MTIPGTAGGLILTPNYPSPYIENLECTYNIIGPTEHLARINITDLSLSKVDALPTADGNDEGDAEPETITNQTSYLDVYLSRNAKAQRITKNLTSPLELVSENNQIRLVFHGANNPQNGRGMSVKFNFHLRAQCGGVSTTSTGSVTSIFHGVCQWVIETPGRKHIQIYVRTVGAAHVMIYDNSTGTQARLLLDETTSAYERTYNFDEYVDSNLVTIIITNKFMNAFARIHYKPATSGKSKCWQHV